MPANAPSAPTVIARRSLSLPTQANDEILAFDRRAFGRRGGLAAEFFSPCLGLGGRPVENRDLVATFFSPDVLPWGNPSRRDREKRLLAMCPTLGYCRHWRSRTVFLEKGGGLVRWLENRFRWKDVETGTINPAP